VTENARGSEEKVVTWVTSGKGSKTLGGERGLVLVKHGSSEENVSQEDRIKGGKK